MTSDLQADPISCHRCGYDLRMHGADARCPECNTPVSESISEAKVPTRPAWKDSDPRWRQRVLAGLWVLTLMPLVAAAISLNWISRIPAPQLFDYKGLVVSLDHTLFGLWPIVGPWLFVCGIGPLFARERFRRQTPLDFTRRWGLIFCYIVLLLTMASVLFLPSLVMLGIAAVFLSIPPEFAPDQTWWFAEVGWIWVRFGPHPSAMSESMLVVASSVAMLMAIGPLYDALRSTSRSWLPLLMLGPLGLFALLYLAVVAADLSDFAVRTNPDYLAFQHFFNTDGLVLNITRDMAIGPPTPLGRTGSSVLTDYQLEAFKWLMLLCITLWLTWAQFSTYFRRQDKNGAPPARVRA